MPKSFDSGNSGNKTLISSVSLQQNQIILCRICTSQRGFCCREIGSCLTVAEIRRNPGGEVPTIPVRKEHRICGNRVSTLLCHLESASGFSSGSLLVGVLLCAFIEIVFSSSTPKTGSHPNPLPRSLFAFCETSMVPTLENGSWNEYLSEVCLFRGLSLCDYKIP